MKVALSWVTDIGATGCVCSHATRICRLFAHLVLVATPSYFSLTVPLSGGATYMIDNVSSPLAGHQLTSESHPVSGLCSGGSCTILGPSLMYNWGYEATMALLANDQLPPTPHELCVKAWMRAVNSTAPTSESSERCVNFSPPTCVFATNTPRAGQAEVQLVLNTFSSSSTRACNDAGSRCLTSLHVVFTAEASDATHELVANGEYSLDNGSTWLVGNGRAFYEQHIDPVPNGTSGEYRRAMQYDVDLLGGASDERAATICYRVVVTDAVTGGASEPLTGCLDVCERLVPFHNPEGYCPTAVENYTQAWGPFPE